MGRRLANKMSAQWRCTYDGRRTTKSKHGTPIGKQELSKEVIVYYKMSSCWDKSGAKFVIQTDLMSGVLDVDTPTPQEAWDQLYSRMFEFRFITYEKFARNLGLERGRFSDNANWAAI
jgi:hypothetical protein